MRALLALASLALLLPAAAAALDGATHAVAMRNSRFDPPVLVIKAGDTVTWTNFDGGIARHTVTDRAGTFGSGVMTQGHTFTQTFHSPGVVLYHCTFHGAMNGVLVVAPA
jgi:plastocyanin